MTHSIMPSSYKHCSLRRTVFYPVWGLFLLLAVSFLTPAHADMYTIEGVEVDVQAKNALEAREKAFSEAQVLAYQKLKERLVEEQVETQASELDAEAISYLVKDFEVTKEQLGAKRYKGVYTIRFNEEAFQQRLVNQEQSFSDIPRGSTLLLPYYRSGPDTLLWSQSNPFMAAWARHRQTANAFTNVVIPIGDIDDVRQVNEFVPLNYDPVLIERMRDRYGANEVIIALATPEVGLSGLQNLKVNLYSAKIRGPQFAGQMTIDGMANEPSNLLYDRAVTKLSNKLKSDWKNQTAIVTGHTSVIKAVTNFSSVREWLQLKRVLETLPGMQSVSVNGLTPREAVLSLQYQGDAQRLALALRPTGYNIGQPASIAQPIYPIFRTAVPVSNAPVINAPVVIQNPVRNNIY
ncbi:MAG: DUF2066 domain-containing protein [Pseudomonadota bacterium]